MKKDNDDKEEIIVASPVGVSLKVDSHFLTEEEKNALRAEAKENVKKQIKKDASEKFRLAEERAIIREQGLKTGKVFDDEEMKFKCDLPEHADSIMINGVRYYHGFTYPVPRHVFVSLQDIQARAWDHDADIRGEKWNPRKRRNVRLSVNG